MKTITKTTKDEAFHRGYLTAFLEALRTSNDHALIARVYLQYSNNNSALAFFETLQEQEKDLGNIIMRLNKLIYSLKENDHLEGSEKAVTILEYVTKDYCENQRQNLGL